MASSARLEVGSVFAREYRVLEPLAEGGMGAVYVVEQLSTRKRRALKVVRPELVRDRKMAERFVQEATVGASIQSEHVVEVIAAGVDEGSGLPWLAMELLDGEDLDALVTRTGRLPYGHALEVFKQLCHGLAAAHVAGVVHRDLKPENVFVARSRRADAPFTVKVLDFGIAKVLQESHGAATTTAVIGSPLWMAPEQIKAERMSPATDVWALGLVAFWLLTGRSYWRAANSSAITLEALLAEKLFAEIEPPSARAAQLGCGEALPPGFDPWFLRCVAREPSQRFSDAGEAFAALSPVLSAAASATVPPTPLGIAGPAQLPGGVGAARRDGSGSGEAFAPTLARSSGAVSASAVRGAGGARGAVYALGGVLLLAAGAYAGVRFKSAMRARGAPAVEGAREGNGPAIAPEVTVVSAPRVPDKLPEATDAGAPVALAVAVDASVQVEPIEAQHVRVAHTATAHTRTVGSETAPGSAVDSANANAHPPSAPGPAPGPRPMPPVSSRLAALAALEAQAERTDAQAASEPNPQRAAALRSAAQSIHHSADEHLDQVEAQARAMMATEPGNAGMLLDYVRQGREFLRRRRAGHP